MGLTFRSRAPESLFLPTVHIHDGTLPDTATFDHTLFAQGAIDEEQWDPSASPPHDDLVQRAKGLLAGAEVVWRRDMKGEFPNRDVTVSA